jgi:iron only hydrogenase large subunit-like protein
MKMPEASRFHSIKIDEKKCIGCVTCMRACPTKAIRVKIHQTAAINYEKCIDCGECLRVCPHNAVVPMTTSSTDLERYKYKVALPSPVLYFQFGQHIMPNEVFSLLEAMGFDYVYDLAITCEMTSIVIEDYLDEFKIPGPVISSICPVVVRLIQGLFPGLCERIIPIEPPREIAAKYLREEISVKHKIPAKDIGIFHITPCAAKVVSINYPASLEKSYLNGVFSIREIYNRMAMKLKQPRPPRMLHSQAPISGSGIGWSFTGGQFRSAKYHSAAVSGVYDTIEILKDVEAGKLKGIRYLECLICPDGCVGGPLTVENRFVARSNALMLIRRYGQTPTVDSYTVKRLYREGFFSFENQVKPKPFPPLDKDRTRALQKLQMKEEIIKKLPGINCGICGAPDCLALADDIAREKAALDQCHFLKKEGKP